MKRIFYIHGLGSNGNGNSAKLLQKYLGEDFEVVSYDIPFDPDEAMDFLKEKIYHSDVKYDCIIGTSLGGFYASLGWDTIPKILVNPALDADNDIREKIGKGTYKYFGTRENGDTEYTIDEDWLRKIKRHKEAFYLEILERVSTWAFFGDKDELLNHQEDFKKDYIGCCTKELGDRFAIIPCGHRLTEEVIKDYIAPKIIEITSVDQNQRYVDFWAEVKN